MSVRLLATKILNKRKKDIRYDLCNFVDEIDYCLVERKTVINVNGEAKKEVTLDFEDLLVFLTRSRYLPTVVTITGKLNFKHQDIKSLVTVSICAYGIFFPVNQRYIGEHFTENVVDDILNSLGFGKV